jgi:hypothetical protein
MPASADPQLGKSLVGTDDMGRDLILLERDDILNLMEAVRPEYHVPF